MRLFYATYLPPIDPFIFHFAGVIWPLNKKVRLTAALMVNHIPLSFPHTTVSQSQILQFPTHIRLDEPVKIKLLLENLRLLIYRVYDTWMIKCNLTKITRTLLAKS